MRKELLIKSVRNGIRWGISLSLFLIVISALLIKSAAQGRIYDEVESIPHRKVGLVLGCSEHLANGRSNLYFRNRINAATALYNHGKVDFLLVSGDNHRVGYDEPADMKAALVARGIPQEQVVCDYAGFRTLDSVVRAKEIFGQSEFTVISQAFHNERAVFIAGHRGAQALGYNARDVGVSIGLKTKGREMLARVKTVLDLYLFNVQPRFLGKLEPIGDSVEPS